PSPLLHRYGCSHGGASVDCAVVVRANCRTGERAGNQVSVPGALRPQRSRQSRAKRGRAARLSDRNGTGAVLHPSARVAAADAGDLLRLPHPILFLKAGSLIEARALIADSGLIALFLGMKLLTKFAGILPLTRYFKFVPREGMYTTLMMSTGLTFGSIAALF